MEEALDKTSKPLSKTKRSIHSQNRYFEKFSRKKELVLLLKWIKIIILFILVFKNTLQHDIWLMFLNNLQMKEAIEFIQYQKYNQRYTLMFTFMSGLLSENDAKSILKHLLGHYTWRTYRSSWYTTHTTCYLLS